MLIFMLALLLPAQAQTARTADCILSNPNSNGEHVDEICWLQFGATGTSLATPYSQQRTFSLPDGSTIQMTVELAGGVNGGNGVYRIDQAPVFPTGSNFSGNSGYYRLLTPNGAVLHSVNGAGNGTVLTLRDVKLFRPNGTEVTNVPFELIVADAERLNQNPEFIDFGVVSGGSPWELVEWLGTAPASAIAIGSSSNASFSAPGGGTYQNLGFPFETGNPAGSIACNPATFIDCLRIRGETPSSNANAAVLASRRDISNAATPFTVITQVHSGAGQAFAVGVRWGGVRLRKALPQGRLNAADQFVYEVTNVLDQSVISAETAGASAISDYISAQATMPGNTLTLTERMTLGSVSTLQQYDRSISCANPGNPGSSTVLPDGPYDPDAPPVVDVLELGDAIECTFSNIPRIIDLVLVKTAPATASAGTEIEYQLAIRNDGTHTATAATFTDTLPVGLGGVSTAGVTCSDEQAGAICGDIAASVSGSDAAGYVITGAIESLPPGASVVIMVRATPLASAVGTDLVNSARVDRAATDLTVGEQDETNNASSATVSVTAPAVADVNFCPVDGGFFNIVNGVGIYQYAPASATDSRVTGLDAAIGGNLNGLMVDPTGRTRLLFHNATGGDVWAYDPTHPTSPGWYRTGATINAPNLPRAGMTADGVGYLITSATAAGTGATAQMYRLVRDGDYGYRVDGQSTLTYDVAPSDFNSGDIAFDSTGTGWLVAGSDLYRVDVDAGTATRQQNFTGAPVGVNYAGAAFGGDGRLYVVNNSGGTYYAMDLAQGTMVAVGTSTSGAGRDLASCSFPAITPAQLRVSKTLASIIRDGATVPAGAPAAPGDLLAYSIEIRHVGGSQAATVFAGNVVETTPVNTTHGAVADDFTCAGGTCTNTEARNIRPGESTAFSFVVQIDATLPATVSQIVNTVAVNGIDCAAAGNDCEETTPVEGEPALSSSKVLTAVNGAAPAGAVALGDVLTYTVVAANTGNVALPTVTVTDTRITPDAITCAPLAAGASCTLVGTYTVTQADVDAGTIANTAVITTPDTPELCPAGSTSAICRPTVEIPTQTAAPALTVVKTAGTPSGNIAGSTIGYSFLVTNTGNVTITNIAIDDSQLDGAAVCPVTTLAPGASTTCTGTHTITQAEVDAGEVLNTATATGTPPGGGTTTSPPDEEDVTLDIEPSLTIVKTAGTPSGNIAGSTIGYSFLVTNTGNVTITNIAIDDSQLDAAAVCPATTLAPGASTTCTGVHTITQAEVDAGEVRNTATATGTPPGGGTTTSPPDDEDVTLERNPSLATNKVLAGNADEDGSGTVTLGDTLSYTVTATNTGTVTLPNVEVRDDRITPASIVCASLAPGASCVLTGTYVVVQADVNAGQIINTATISTDDPAVCPAGNTSAACQPTVTTGVTPYEIEANDDNYGPVNGAEGDPSVGNMLDNDTLNGVPATPDAVTITVGTLPPGIVADPATGVVGVEPGTPAGSYTFEYTICEILNPSNCDTATVTVVVEAAEIVANDDSYGPVNGAEGDPSVGNVLDNDTLNGVPATPETVTITVGTLPPGIVIDTTTGVVGVEPGTPAGSYTFEYTICEILNPSNCDTATVTVVVEAAEIVANDDSYGPVNGAEGDPSVGNVLDNDTLNGVPATPDTVTITVGTLPPGIVIDTTTGVVGVEPGTPAGSYTFEYTICEILNPSNCDTATVTVVVEAPEIVAVDDSAVTEQNTPVTIPVLDDDTLNGVPVDVEDITIVEVTPPSNGRIVILPDGTVVYTPDPGFSGEDSFEYQICEINNPTNCATATVTITVLPNVVEAIDDDAGTAEPGVPTPVVVVDNDSSTGAPLDPGSVTVVTPPAHGIVNCANGICTYTPAFGFSGEDSFVYRVCDTSYPTAMCDTATVTIRVEGAAPLRIAKSVAVREVKVGDLVRYTLTVENVGNAMVTGATVLDTPPQGFSYVDGSIASSDGRALAVSGYNPIRIASLDLAPGDTASISYLLRVGAGIRAGSHVNQAVAQTEGGMTLSNIATAQVQTAFDPLLDDSLVFGTVFDDRNGDGWQASAALRGVRVQGGFAPGAYIAGSTTIDRGDGPQPLADASAPLLHGVALDTIPGRQSVADPVETHQVVIRQRLRNAAFTDDFALTSGDGATLYMAADGSTRLERSGDVAKGLSAAEPVVTRRVSQDGEGVLVEYVIGNAGIDERGIPGVRIASVEGLLIETDQYGRYHLVDVPGGNAMHGRNFILKVDPSTLPPGTEFTTANPLVRRVTPGLPVRFDFGVRLPVVELQGGSEVVELELGEVFFAPHSSALREAYLPAIEAMAGQIERYRGGQVVVTGEGEHEALAFARAAAVRDALQARITPAAAEALRVELRTQVDDPHALVAGVDNSGVLLGTVLFDTDKSDIRPEFEALLDAVARRLEALGGGMVGIVGHTDVRGSHAYNVELGLRRAQSVFNALSGRLSPQVRARTRVETSRDPAASVGEARK
ncbi:Ig-like domain-containing protein [Luteimonas sp. 3794]|uniref:DUF7507 domain-containing protein n=1 Tax=Luteimonas sp. 3794 TaxID=2817730 RepID=UPI00286C0FE3|nr:Ig-like domain-containing protein [Luteimonas sp. 3794]